jgi:hypothetical protein
LAGRQSQKAFVSESIVVIVVAPPPIVVVVSA